MLGGLNGGIGGERAWVLRVLQGFGFHPWARKVSGQGNDRIMRMLISLRQWQRMSMLLEVESEDLFTN